MGSMTQVEVVSLTDCSGEAAEAERIQIHTTCSRLPRRLTGVIGCSFRQIVLGRGCEKGRMFQPWLWIEIHTNFYC